MIESASPPIYVNVDGHAYGVYEIRSTDELERIQAAAASAPPSISPAPSEPIASPSFVGISSATVRNAGGAAGPAMTLAQARAREQDAARAERRLSFVGARKSPASA